MSITSLLHGGNGLVTHTNNPIHPQPQAIISSSASPSGYIRDSGDDRRRNIPAGERPFFGTIKSINSSTLIIQSQFRGRENPQITPRVAQTLTINLDTNTQYVGGTQSYLRTNIRVAGIGKINNDGSITASQIRINPTLPSPRAFRSTNSADKTRDNNY